MILWDVDTQVDFMLPEGKLYVPGAEETAPAMGRLVSAARAAGLVHVASADDHELTDAEISSEPDFSTTYPPHCLRGTRGARRIPETEQAEPVPLGLELVPERYLEGREYLLLKKHFDVFTNPHAGLLLERLDPDAVIVFGVATDVCDHATILGLRERGRRVIFVEDAARGLDETRTAARLAEWRDRGVTFSTVDGVLSLI
ncbi:MAG TPA: isochorismatase family cysteine hydrolase [Gaiellaceae bacterium]|nr:isochorismatase family cysteine hydrolase [Gaiellaceae bacterium]